MGGVMGRKINRLTALSVKAAATGYHADGANLYLQVTASGAKSWVFRFMRDGRAREMGLGAAHTVTLAHARVLAAECRRQVLAGEDPIELRDRAREAAQAARARVKTFDECVADFISGQQGAWRNEKHRGQWISTLKTYVSPVLGSLPVQDVDQGLVLRVLDPIWREKTETASRLRGRIEKVLDYAASRGLRSGENPARWGGHLAMHLPKRSQVAAVQHHPALPYADLPAFMQGLREAEGIGARCLEFTILTCARTGEAINAEWSEIDIVGRTWTIPAARMKAHKEHRVPLSQAALAVLTSMKESSESQWVFPGGKRGKSLSNMALSAVLRRMERTGLTVHGFRSTFRDWCAEATEFPTEMAEMALAHAIGNRVEAAYRRGDLLAKRVSMMAAWADFAGGLFEPKGQVIPIRKKIN
jgi:integrase